ncbi:Uncharacterised protein [uncultured archaeon]|nr:Uncharacterised protein [uncultured archaeon]
MTAFFNTFQLYNSLGITMKRLAILLGIALLASLVVSAAGQGTQGIRVFGEGTATVPADTVIISVGVQSNNTNASQAAAENALLLNKTIDALTGAGVQKDEIMPGQSSGISSSHFVSNICRRVNNTTICENTSNASSLLTSSILIRLKTTDQDKVNSVLETAKSRGAMASVMGYSISDKSQAIADARKKAIENSKSNAEDMASAAGVKLGKAIDISDYGYPDISFNEPFGSPVNARGTVSVTSYVAVTYEIL